jgi:cell division protein FtsL
MRKFLLTLTAVLALTVASKYMTVQAEEMAAEEPEAGIENMINEAMNEMNEVGNEVVNEESNEVVDEGAASGGMTQ